ncbi:MAG TPA: hypothetical protein VLC46_02195 [Thermoanaerobaculia bacterium]|jgi:hypothetical protein|nr:hypothetical protein [Thermoanaerobaculia bacterium]
MLLSLLIYCGGAAMLAGAGAMIPRRTRGRGAAVFIGGIASVAVAVFWPVREEHTAEAHSHLDEIVPRWQFGERHEIRIDAPPARIFEAIRDVTPREIRFFDTLTAIRRLGGDGRESIINAPDDEPILAVATRTGFQMLVDDAPRELVIGTRVAPGSSAVMNFRVESGVRLTTETRVVLAPSGSTRRLIAVYWRIIRPGSGIIRRYWLQAIKRRAEAKR